MEHKAAALSPAEWRIMESLWERPKTLMELVRELGVSMGWAKSTIATMLYRMEDKKFIAYDTPGRAKVYRPVLQRQTAVAEQTNSLLHRAYHGSVGLLMNTLVETSGLSKTDIQELYAILQKAEEAVK